MNTTARDVIEMLRRHYLPEGRPPGGIFAPEIGAPGNSGRRADLIWQGCTAAGGHELIGHEVKVTRQDLLAELADPAKSDPWQKYCHRWYLVVPDAHLLDGLELPHTWGVLTPPSGRRTRTMTVHIPAPALKPDEQAPALKTLATWLHWKRDSEQRNHRLIQDEARRLREVNERLQRESTYKARPRRKDEEIIARIIAELGGTVDGDQIGSWTTTVHIDDVVAALRDLAEAKNRRAQAENSHRMCLDRLRGLGKTVEHALLLAERKTP
ncbi:hypothetical protein [Umezawaea tangerina]|uniref:MmcB family DNA repair protein n=1 Tax=Umezawaea tangerina TaxID=84725 RepID=A0A2T0SPG3_9PSEU|nr:hypothetical protein [Umezawaea tangerina]PRY35311.1 hypothetical protein CLV43_114229 [Umezawaea tangerina]